MTDPLVLAEHLVGGWDSDGGGWIARDHTAGPAGSAGLELPGEVEVDVDVAEPLTLTNLWVPSHSVTAAEVALALLGPPRGNELLAMGEGDRDALRILGAGDELAARRARRTQPRTLREGGGVDPALAGLALARSALEEAAGSRVATGLAALDAAIAGLDLSDRLDVLELARGDAARAADALLAAAVDGELDGLDVPAPELSDALAVIEELLPDPLRRTVRSLRVEIDDGTYDLLTPTIAEGEAPDADAAFAEAAEAAEGLPLVRSLPTAMPAAAGEGASRAKKLAVAPMVEVIDRAGLPTAFLTAIVAARATTASEIEVRVQDLDAPRGGWWVRAQRPDGVLLAVAPLRPAEGDEVARLLVPPAWLRTVEVDITDTPAIPRPGSQIRRVSDAIAEGRRAARAERVGRRREAERAWTACAEHWTAAGDPARAGLALERAAGGSRALFPTLLVDRVG